MNLRVETTFPPGVREAAVAILFVIEAGLGSDGWTDEKREEFLGNISVVIGHHTRVAELRAAAEAVLRPICEIITYVNDDEHVAVIHLNRAADALRRALAGEKGDPDGDS